MAMQYFTELGNQHPSTGPWETQTVWTAIKFAITVFPQVLQYYLSPSKYLHISDLQDWDKLGAFAFFLSCMGTWAFYDTHKWENHFNFVCSFSPTNFYGLKSKIEQYYIPQCFQTGTITTKQYNISRDENHWTQQMTPVCFMYVISAYQLHYQTLGNLFGQAKYLNNKGFDTDSFVQTTANEECIKAAFANYITKSMDVPYAEEKAVIDTFSTISTIDIDPYSQTNRLILTSITKKPKSMLNN